jgi:transmembrane sensor
MTTPDKKAIYAATNWFVILTSGDATDQDRKDWERWLNSSETNKEAWQQVETVTHCFTGLESKTSIAVLNRPIDTRHIASYERRKAIKSLSILLVVGTTSWYGYKQKPWYAFIADYSTAVGEIKNVKLDDGSQLTLNTDTKVAISFSDNIRQVRLLHGEVYVETAPDNHAGNRPFVLTTEHGTVKALGTKFSTRIFKNRSCVNVYEDAVEVKPIHGQGDKVIVNAGELVKFTADIFQQKMLFESSTISWMNGFIIVDSIKLDQFVEELSRYRRGVLRCDPAIANLEISGAFPVNDIPAVLNSLTSTLPVRVQSYTQYWTMLKPA